MGETCALMDGCTGLQHIGIPTTDIKKTCDFYQGIGFRVLHEKVIRDHQHVSFLGFESVILEVYEEQDTPHRAGAIDHIAFNCMDIESAFRNAEAGGYAIVSDGIEELPFWENGVRFFIINGPNGERLEWNQHLGVEDGKV